MTAVKEALGDRFTATMENIYRKTIKFILTTLTTGFMYYDMEGTDDESRRSTGFMYYDMEGADDESRRSSVLSSPSVVSVRNK